MDNPTVSWEIRDENDRIISILAWVVVVVLVVYAMIFFYKQIHQPARSARPVVGPEEANPGVQVASRPETARPRAVVTRISAELEDLPPTSKKVGAPLATAENKPASGDGVEIDIGQYATPAEAIAAMRQLEDVSEWKVRIRAKNDGYTLRAGPLPATQLASIEGSLKAKGMSVERHTATAEKGVGTLSTSSASRAKPTKSKAEKTVTADAAAAKKKTPRPAPRATRSEALAHDVPGHAPSAAEREERPMAEPNEGGYYLQVVTYAEPEHAAETRQRYKEKGIQARVEKVAGRGTTWYRVMVGAYPSKQAAVGDEGRVAGVIGVNPGELLLKKR